MKNKIKLKKFLYKSILLLLILIPIFLVIHSIEYHIYTKNFNNKLLGIVSKIEEKYPNLTKNEIIEVINSSETKNDIFKKYNIDIDKDSIILENNKIFFKFSIYNILFINIAILLFLMLFLKYNKNKDKDIRNITKYIEEINRKNYKLEIDDISEDELSILKNEIYKTTIMLKEQAENSNKEKLELKTSLSDISHQLKTPLTSILIALDNLIDDPNMDVQTREDFIFDIKREINNINFLVQNLLKLSKLDTNTVNFMNENVSLNKIVNESITKLAMLCDLKNINIEVNSNDDVTINADFNWQVEAISNIIKNCIEHSNNNNKIEITIEKNKMYSQIIIQDFGNGINQKDLPHIFERFYKGSNSSSDSIGIGLALSKSIIEKTNGKIICESKINIGTKFIIRYY